MSRIVIAGFLLIAVTLAVDAQPELDDPAVRQLVEQGRYWQSRSRWEEAAQTWHKLLLSHPQHAEGLAGLAFYEVQAGRVDAARTYLDELRKVHPLHSSIHQLTKAVASGGGAQRSALDQARELASQGQYTAALEQYTLSFGGLRPEGELALEYYQTLGATDEGWEAARHGLTDLSAAHPDEPRYAFALAQHLTYRETHRREGIARLQKLAQNPERATPSRQAWREALLWLKFQRGDEALFEAYLQAYGKDDALQARLAELRKTRMPEQDRALKQGFEALERQDVRRAKQSFEQLLQVQAEDATALAGLGIAHFREGDYHKASDYLGRALKVAPEKRNQWGKMYHEARAWASVKDAEQARGAGDWGHAEQLLRRAVQVSSGEPSIRVSLADVLAEQGRYREAENEYRGVLQRQPEHANALQGLIKTLSQQEKTTEAVALIEGLSDAQKRSIAETGIQLRATHYRARAASLAQRGDDAGAQRALEQALVLDPQDAWVRLDLARLYRHQGADDKAQSLMQGLLLTEPDNPEGLYASALFSAESGNPSEALRQLSTIPTKSQTAAMMALAQRLRVSATIEKALALARRGQAAAARDMLAELERAAGVNPDVVGPVAQAWVDVGDSARGLALLRQAMSGDGAKPSLRTQYAGVLLQVGLDAELVPLLRELENDPQLSYPERKAVEELSFGYAVRQADRAREKGDLAGAYERLAPYLRQNPPHPKALIMLGHLYREAGEPRKALDLYLEILAQQPKEMDARRAAFAAAIELGELRQAESLVEAGLKYFPDSPQANTLAGHLARIRGRDGEAIQYFERALELLGSSHQAPLPEMWSRSSTDGNPFASIATGPSTKMGVADGPAAPPGRRSAHALSRADLKAFEVGQDGRAGTPESSSMARPWTTPSANLLTANKSYYNPFGQPAGETQHRTSSVGAQAQMRTDEIRESHQLLHDQLLSELNAMRAARGAQAATGLSIRARDGEEGLGELHDLQIPLEAEVSPQGNWGRLSLRVVPVSLRAGDLNPGDVDKIQRFGTNALAVDQSGSGRIEQEDQGVGIAAQWQYRDWGVDLGSSGLGFAVENVIGGLRWQPSLGRFRFGFAASRRSVTDSLLSYAGTEDNVSGVTWGGVVSTGGRFDLAYDEGQYGLYGSAAYATLDGERVASNTKLRLGGGLFWRAYEDADQRVTAGVDITYFGYDENLSHFTLGQGGYFSPQHYTSFGVPVTWSGRHGRVAFGLTGYLGLQTFQEDDSPVFPNDRELQDRLEALAQSTPGVRTFFPGQSKTGISYNFSADLSFQIQPKLAVGGNISFDNARDFKEQTGMVYVRYFFQPQRQPVAFPPRSVRPRYGETP